MTKRTQAYMLYRALVYAGIPVRYVENSDKHEERILIMARTRPMRPALTFVFLDGNYNRLL